MHPDFEIIAALPDCRNGNCSTAWRNYRTGAVRLRGKDPDNPGREFDIEWTAAEFALLAPQIAALLQQ